MELFPRFHLLMDALISAIDPLNPEATSRVFQTMAHLFKHLYKPIINVCSKEIYCSCGYDTTSKQFIWHFADRTLIA